MTTYIVTMELKTSWWKKLLRFFIFLQKNINFIIRKKQHDNIFVFLLMNSMMCHDDEF